MFRQILWSLLPCLRQLLPCPLACWFSLCPFDFIGSLLLINHSISSATAPPATSTSTTVVSLSPLTPKNLQERIPGGRLILSPLHSTLCGYPPTSLRLPQRTEEWTPGTDDDFPHIKIVKLTLVYTPGAPPASSWMTSQPPLVLLFSSSTLLLFL